MRYYIDNEFLEGRQDKTIFGIKYGETKPTIDLISIGIVSEDNREYYAISKDFNLKEAWNKFQMKQVYGDARNIYQEGVKEYWLRENVLKPIFNELVFKEHLYANQAFQRANVYIQTKYFKFTYKNIKYLINKYGKTNKQIAEEIKEFCKPDRQYEIMKPITLKYSEIQNPEFYGYYADYDWVVFCWLFGKMIDLPKGFPMYCIDLKQELDRKVDCFTRNEFFTAFDFKQEELKELTLDEKLKHIKYHVNYPQETDTHHALSDAKFNKQLHEFLNTL